MPNPEIPLNNEKSPTLNVEEIYPSLLIKNNQPEKFTNTSSWSSHVPTLPQESLDLKSLFPCSKQSFVTSNSVISIPIISVWQWGTGMWSSGVPYLHHVYSKTKNFYYVAYIAELDSGISISIQWWILLFWCCHFFAWRRRNTITSDRHESFLRFPLVRHAYDSIRPLTHWAIRRSWALDTLSHPERAHSLFIISVESRYF